MQLVFSKKFQLHQFRKQVSLSFPFFQSDESRTFPVKISNSSSTNRDVLTAGSVGELNDLKIIRMLTFLKIAKLISKASFFFNKLNKVLRSQFFFDRFFSLFKFGQPLS